MDKQIIKLFVNMAVLYMSTIIFPNIIYNNFSTIIIASIVLWIINLIIRPIILLISLPINILTIGLFSLVINTWMILIADTLVAGLKIPNFITAFAISIFITLGNIIFKKNK